MNVRYKNSCINVLLIFNAMKELGKSFSMSAIIFAITPPLTSLRKIQIKLGVKFSHERGKFLSYVNEITEA